MKVIEPRAALQALCPTYDPRNWMHQPFAAAGMQAATNGHMLIALHQATAGEDTPGIATNLPDLLTRAQAIATELGREWTRLDTITLPELKLCRECKGKGRVYETKCPDCDGEGDFQHGSHWYQCQECNGDGSTLSTTPTHPDHAPTTCSSCAGTGETPRHAAAMGAHYGSHYLRLLASLPNCEITAPEHPMAATFCRFDGGIAVVMPRLAD